MSRPVLRPATHRDVPALRKCYTTSWSAAFDHLGTGLDADDAWDRSGLARPSGPVLLACTDDRVLGLAAVSDDGRCLDKLYVHPDAQGHGLGSALLSAIGPVEHLWAFEVNRPAIGFYRSHGWTLDGTSRVGDVGLQRLASVRLVAPRTVRTA